MQVYAGCSGKPKHHREMKEKGYGMCIVEQLRLSGLAKDIPQFLDNGAYNAYANGRKWEAAKFITLLERAPKRGVTFDFVVVPDKVAAGLESFEFSMMWLPVLREITDFPLYLAVQDGMRADMIEGVMHQIDGLFVGGSMKWKKKTGEKWVRLAHRHGKPCHIGRVGTFKKLCWAKKIGAHSVDSSNFFRGKKGSNKGGPDAITWAQEQEVLEI
jgi:hypothetical protein